MEPLTHIALHVCADATDRLVDAIHSYITSWKNLIVTLFPGGNMYLKAQKANAHSQAVLEISALYERIF